MPRKAPQRDSVPPSLSSQRAIELLRAQLGMIERIEQLPSNDPEIKKWELTTENILNATFGMPNGDKHQNTKQFAYASGGPLHMGMSPREQQVYHQVQTRNRRAVLKSIIQQLELLAPPAAQVAEGQYRFHPEIERVSYQLFRDGHYKQAAFEAYIRVIDEVKARSGLTLDGDPLMNRALGCENQTPIIQFTDLQTDADRDEQKGLMFLFKGIVGMRNAKAHSNRLFNDPSRAHEYLALASLLMRLLEIATINRRP